MLKNGEKGVKSLLNNNVDESLVYSHSHSQFLWGCFDLKPVQCLSPPLWPLKYRYLGCLQSLSLYFVLKKQPRLCEIILEMASLGNGFLLGYLLLNIEQMPHKQALF